MNNSEHFTDSEGRPAGGTTYGTGFAIGWQHGPIVRDRGINGASVEDVIRAAMDRLRFFQNGPFECRYNANALIYLQRALFELDDRTQDRVAREVEGTYSV